MLFLAFILSAFPILVFSDNEVYWCFPGEIFLGNRKKSHLNRKFLVTTVAQLEVYNVMKWPKSIVGAVHEPPLLSTFHLTSTLGHPINTTGHIYCSMYIFSKISRISGLFGNSKRSLCIVCVHSMTPVVVRSTALPRLTIVPACLPAAPAWICR